MRTSLCYFKRLSVSLAFSPFTFPFPLPQPHWFSCLSLKSIEIVWRLLPLLLCTSGRTHLSIDLFHGCPFDWNVTSRGDLPWPLWPQHPALAPSGNLSVPIFGMCCLPSLDRKPIAGRSFLASHVWDTWWVLRKLFDYMTVEKSH